MSAQQKTPQPPQPPPFERRIMLPALQLIGIPLLMLLPILAVAGVFGSSMTTESAANDALALRVESPIRTRYNLPDRLHIEVTNLASSQPVTVTVEFSRAYVDAFADVSFFPDVQEVTPEVYRVALPEIAAGEARVIDVEARADKYWQHIGQVTASVANGSPGGDAAVSVPLRTFTYP